MDGDFKTDITRDSFNITNRLKPDGHRRNFSRVLKQQGRIDLDADWNELVDILLQQQRTALIDIIGPHAGPADDTDNVPGFKIGVPINPVPLITNHEKFVHVGTGHYYVDGILCEAMEGNYMVSNVKDDNPSTQYLLYLDIWEREVTALEDDAIRESALGGPDTATRAEVVWRISAKKAVDMVGGSVENLPKGTVDEVSNAWTKLLHDQAFVQSPALLKARTDPTATYTDPCVTSPLSTYRGLENQLYRVEIQRGGKAQADGTEQDYATFKWSRENASITFLVDGKVSISETVNVTLKNLGPDDSRYALKPGNWVELIDLSLVPDETPGLLFRVETVNTATMQVTLTIAKGQKAPATSSAGPLLLRRWDYKPGDPKDKEQEDRPITIANDGAATLVENHWLTLEEGVQVEFFTEEVGTTSYRSGDYWLIPARTGTGELEWPMLKDTTKKRVPLPLFPQGVFHHYAPLALVTFKADGTIGDKPGAAANTPDIINLRRKINQGWAAF